MEIDRRVLTEVEPHRYVAEASDLGLRAGQWPAALLVPPDFGNGHALFPAGREIKDGDLFWVDYRQSAGIVSLRVFND